MGYLSLPSVLNAKTGITSCYCVILKIVIWHDGIKTNQDVFFLFYLKKEQNVSFQKTKNNFLRKKEPRWVVVLKKNG